MNDAMILSFILNEERKSVEQSLADNPTQEHDPFRKLPPELIHHVTDYLEGHEIMSLCECSRSVRQATSSQGFWKRLLLCEQSWLWDTPFSVDFWEISLSAEYTGSPAQVPIDWERLYVVLEKSTAKCFGMKGRYMGLANRRRIWKVCEEMASVYWERFWPQKDDIWEAERLAGPIPPPDNSTA